MSISLGVFAALLAAGLIASSAIGGWVAGRRGWRREKSSLVETTASSILGLMLAFTLTGSAGRLETRRSASIDEANAIGSACLASRLLPERDQPEIRRLYKEYIDNRLAFNDQLSGTDPAHPATRSLLEIQGDIWRISAAGSRGEDRLLVLNAVSHMIDASSSREVRTKIFLPAPLLTFLVLLSVICAGFVGVATAAQGPRMAWTLRGLFVLIVAGALSVMVDMDNPRVGLIRMNEVDSLLQENKQLLR